MVSNHSPTNIKTVLGRSQGFSQQSSFHCCYCYCDSVPQILQTVNSFGICMSHRKTLSTVISGLLGSHTMGPPFPTIYPERGHAALLTPIHEILKCQIVLHCCFTHVHCFELLCNTNLDMFSHSVLLFVLLYFVQVTTRLLETEEIFLSSFWYIMQKVS
jgi:hypothetical protein